MKLPVLVVTGMQDRVFLDLADLDQLYQRLPDARHLKLENAGHILPAERPEELTRALLGFAAELRP
ncbi:MAG: alpha/beta hydrolase [Motiliproteus sp.]